MPQSGFFTIADLLHNKARHFPLFMVAKNTSTIWRAFSMAMVLKIFGINKITKTPKFTGTWGVSDEDYLTRSMKLSRNYKMKVNRFLV